MQNDILKFTIQRFDSLLATSNIKGSFLIAYNTFICSGIFSSYKDLSQLIDVNSKIAFTIFNLLVVAIIILSAISITLTCLAIIPYLRSGNSSKENYHSVIFFKSIAEFEKSEYANRIKNTSEKDINADLTQQIYILSKGLEKKYNLLFLAGWIIPIQILLMIIAISTVILTN